MFNLVDFCKFFANKKIITTGSRVSVGTMKRTADDRLYFSILGQKIELVYADGEWQPAAPDLFGQEEQAQEQEQERYYQNLLSGNKAFTYFENQKEIILFSDETTTFSLQERFEFIADQAAGKSLSTDFPTVNMLIGHDMYQFYPRLIEGRYIIPVCRLSSKGMVPVGKIISAVGSNVGYYFEQEQQQEQVQEQEEQQAQAEQEQQQEQVQEQEEQQAQAEQEQQQEQVQEQEEQQAQAEQAEQQEQVQEQEEQQAQAEQAEQQEQVQEQEEQQAQAEQEQQQEQEEQQAQAEQEQQQEQVQAQAEQAEQQEEPTPAPILEQEEPTPAPIAVQEEPTSPIYRYFETREGSSIGVYKAGDDTIIGIADKAGNLWGWRNLGKQGKKRVKYTIFGNDQQLNSKELGSIHGAIIEARNFLQAAKKANKSAKAEIKAVFLGQEPVKIAEIQLINGTYELTVPTTAGEAIVPKAEPKEEEVPILAIDPVFNEKTEGISAKITKLRELKEQTALILEQLKAEGLSIEQIKALLGN